MNTRILFAVSALIPLMHAADLKPETVKAWDEYVQAANFRMEERARGNAPFLWASESPDRMRKVLAGEVVVAPAAAHAPVRVASGLIHDWIGVTFIPHARLKDVLSVARDYPRYHEFYQPSVIDAKLLQQKSESDRFSMVLMNKSLFLKTALESEYESRYVQIDSKRWYSVSSSTRVQEIEGYGQSGEHKLPEGEGSGYIWRLISFTRFAERDGGVYVELEAIALSRDIPASLHWVVDPIVRRVSRSSLLVTLRQTQEAVRTEQQCDATTVASLQRQ